MPVRPLVQVAVAVIERDGRYLLTRRHHAVHQGGCWEFPGGKRHPGESWPACLRRELAEELGVRARIGRRLTTLRFRYPDRRVCLEVFRCRIIGEPKPLASQAIRWVSMTQLKRLRLPPADRPLIELLASSNRLSSLRSRAILKGR